MNTAHHQERRRQELASSFGSNLRNRKHPDINTIPSNYYPHRARNLVGHVDKSMKKKNHEGYRPIGATCLARKSIPKSKKHQEVQQMLNSNKPTSQPPGIGAYHRLPQMDLPPDLMDFEMDDMDDSEEDESRFRCPSSSIIPETTFSQRMKIGFAVLMIPSLIVIMNGHKKFNSNSSNSNVDFGGAGGAMGGFGGVGGGMGSFGAGGGGRRGLPGSGFDGLGVPDLDDPMAALKKHRSAKMKKMKGKKKKGPKKMYNGETVEENMRRMMGGFGLEHEEHLSKIRDQIQQAKGGEEGEEENEGNEDDPLGSYRHLFPGVGRGAFEGNEEGEEEAEEGRGTAGEDENVEDVGDEEELDLSDGNAVPEDYERMIYDDDPMYDRLSRRQMVEEKHLGNPDPGIKSETDTETPTADPDDIRQKLRAAEIPTLKSMGYKVILIWSSSDVKLHEVPLGISPFSDNDCPKDKCVVSRNKTYAYLSDALIITPNEQQLPSIKTSPQTWILLQTKPNATFSKEIEEQNINISWSTNFHSNISFSPQTKEEVTISEIPSLSPDQLVALKQSKIFQVWNKKKAISNPVLYWADTCDFQDPRVDFFNENSIEVDVFASCQEKSICSKIFDEDDPLMNTMSEMDCYKKLLDEYYMFSLIPSPATINCSNFVHEKLLKSLETTAVPVADIYSFNSIPESSVINAVDFDQKKDEIAIKMKSIMNDVKSYKSFLMWKKDVKISSKRHDLCKLCSLLHESGVLTSFSAKQWIDVSQKECAEP